MKQRTKNKNKFWVFFLLVCKTTFMNLGFTSISKRKIKEAFDSRALFFRFVCLEYFFQKANMSYHKILSKKCPTIYLQSVSPFFFG